MLNIYLTCTDVCLNVWSMITEEVLVIVVGLRNIYITQGQHIYINPAAKLCHYTLVPRYRRNVINGIN